MKAEAKIIACSARSMETVPDCSIDLVVTSPPYPMIEMWDKIFTKQNESIGAYLSAGEGTRAFQLMHGVLDEVWAECDRVLKLGGIACINIGDATRSVNGDFQLYSNHTRILNSFQERGFATLPDVLWRKPTNAPNKFMGSGMLPVGAYVTYEHEYILILRKGKKRSFVSEKEKSLRRESAFFWEERNVWFSDVWSDVRGTSQGLADSHARSRSAAFPFEIAYRLVCMYSVKGDVVLDPFAGTGTTLAASLTAGRNSVGIEIDETLIPSLQDSLLKIKPFANELHRNRLNKHIEWVAARVAEKGDLRYRNTHYGFPVMTSQEQELLFNDIDSVGEWQNSGSLLVSYKEKPQSDICIPKDNEKPLIAVKRMRQKAQKATKAQMVLML